MEDEKESDGEDAQKLEEQSDDSKDDKDFRYPTERINEIKENKPDLWRMMYSKRRIDVTGKLVFLIICQIMLILFLGAEAINSEDMISAYHEYPDGIQIVLCRFLCGIFLHISLADELDQSFKFMKYSMNHPWKFRSWVAAFFVGFAQMSVIFLVEAVNLAILLTNNTILDVIMNFLALVIISEFDDYFFLAVRTEPLCKLISDGEMSRPGYEEIKLEEVLKI